MPTSVQSAVSASPSVWVDASDCDREPARDNVIPFNVNNHRRASPGTGRLHRDPGSVHRHQLPFDDRLRLPAEIANVDTLAVEALVLGMGAQWPLGTGRGNLEVIGPCDEVRVFDKRTCDPADALAILDRDGLVMVDGDAQRAPRLAGLVERVELEAHVLKGRLEQLFDGRYGPGRHVRSPRLP